MSTTHRDPVPTCSPSQLPLPSQEEQEDLLLACRYGDLGDVQELCALYGPGALAEARDEHGNTVLHMACGNGHLDILTYLLPRLPRVLHAHPNNAGSTPLHWAALNRHLSAMESLIQFPSNASVDSGSGGGRGGDACSGTGLIDVRNAAGRTPLGEAELAGWDEGAKWLVQVMNLDQVAEGHQEGEEQEQEGADGDCPRAVEVEIQDAEGRVAKMKIGRGAEASLPVTPSNGEQETQCHIHSIVYRMSLAKNKEQHAMHPPISRSPLIIGDEVS